MMASNLSLEYWKMECSLRREDLLDPGRHNSFDGHFHAKLSTSDDSWSRVCSPQPLQRGGTEQRNPASISQLTTSLGAASLSFSSTASRLTHLGLLQSFLALSNFNGEFLFLPPASESVSALTSLSGLTSSCAGWEVTSESPPPVLTVGTDSSVVSVGASSVDGGRGGGGD